MKEANPRFGIYEIILSVLNKIKRFFVGMVIPAMVAEEKFYLFSKQTVY